MGPDFNLLGKPLFHRRGRWKLLSQKELSLITDFIEEFFAQVIHPIDLLLECGQSEVYWWQMDEAGVNSRSINSKIGWNFVEVYVQSWVTDERSDAVPFL